MAAVLPGWPLVRARARWRAEHDPDADRRRSAFRPRRCWSTCCRQPPVPVPVRCAGSWAARRLRQAAKRRPRCPDGLGEVLWCGSNVTALPCVFFSLCSQYCACTRCSELPVPPSVEVDPWSLSAPRQHRRGVHMGTPGQPAPLVATGIELVDQLARISRPYAHGYRISCPLAHRLHELAWVSSLAAGYAVPDHSPGSI